MTQSTRIYRHSAAGTDWAALLLGAGLGLTLALQATTLRSGDFKDFYSVVVTLSRLAALVGTYLSVVGIFLVARIPVVKPWSIGVVNPDDRSEIVKVYEITDSAIATSGTYERGAHIHDPLNRLIAIGAKSATVVGAEGWLCDAMATAVMVAGQDGAKWFGQPQLAGYQVFAVNRHEQTAWSI
jgi:hypothetical protein